MAPTDQRAIPIPLVVITAALLVLRVVMYIESVR